MKHRRFVRQRVLLSTSLPQGGGFGLLTRPTRDSFWKRLRSKESVIKVRSTGDGDPPSSCPCYLDIERAGASQGSRVVSANTNLNLRFGVLAACTFRTPSTDGMILVQILNLSFEDVRILRRTILGRWSHLPKQTVISDGTASSAVPTTAPSSDVPDLVDSSEFSSSEVEKTQGAPH